MSTTKKGNTAVFIKGENMKLTYLHCYADDLWEGYEKNGLLRENFGIRFPQSVHLPEELMFNELAKKNGFPTIAAKFLAS